MEKISCVRNATDKLYSYIHKTNTNPLPVKFSPHIHDSAEVYMMLSGDVEYVIEGNCYKLSPFDVLVMNENELHNVRVLGNATYERVVLNIKSDFFKMYDIENYKSIFTNRTPGNSNLIKGYIAQTEGLYDSLMRIEQYIHDGNKKNDMIIRSMIIEFLHILNKISVGDEKQDKKSLIVADIISYINKNISQPLSLEDTAKEFFISKYHLCRIFKESTGFTFNKYITIKRVALVRTLCQQGYTISEAITSAGFGNYSNFYRIYVALTGHSPKEDLKSSNKKD